MNARTPWGSIAGSRAHARHHRVLRSLGLETSCFISQALADNALDREVGAGRVIDPKLFTVGIAEIKLRKVAVKVRFTHMEVAADDPALQDRKEALDRIGVERAAHIFFGTVVDDFMPEVTAHVPILARVVGAEEGVGVNLADKDGAEVGSGDARNMRQKRIDAEATAIARAAGQKRLNKREEIGDIYFPFRAAEPA
jgi:hypothetical protein